MSKRLQKQLAIDRCIQNCTNLYFETGKYVSDVKVANACRSYAGNVNPENVIAIIDETVFRSGKKGLLFTEEGIYYSMYDGGFFSYADPRGFESMTGYNHVALNELVAELHSIEIAPSGMQVLENVLNETENFLNELSGKPKENDMDNQDVLGALETYRSSMKENVVMLDDFIGKVNKSDEEMSEYLFNLVMLASTYSGDKELIDIGIYTEEQKEQVYIMHSNLKDLYELVEESTNVLADNTSVEKIELLKSIKLFSFRIKNIISDFNDDENISEMYENSQKAVIDLRNSYKKIIKSFNGLIEIYM